MFRNALAAMIVFTFLIVAAHADENDAIKILEKAGSKIYRDDKKDGKPIVAVEMWGPSFSSELLVQMKEFKHLERLRLAGPWVNEKGLKELHGIKTLKVLRVRGPGVTDNAIKDLEKALPEIKVTRIAPDDRNTPLWP